MTKLDIFNLESTKEELLSVPRSNVQQTLNIIIDFAINNHLKAKRMIDVLTELSDLRDELKDLDHMALQWFHNCIIVTFCVKYCLNADLLNHLKQSRIHHQKLLFFGLIF